MPGEDDLDILDESSIGMRAELKPGRGLSTPQVEVADFPRFRRLTFFSVLAGLCPLLPVPFLDDWALGRVQRRMVRELGESRRLGLTESEVRILGGGGERRVWPGVVKGAALAVRSGARRVLRKVFRTAFYILLVRDGVHRAVETFVQGYLLLHAARLPHALHPAARTEERVRRVRNAVVETMQGEDVTPLRRAVSRSFRRSFGPLFKAAALLGTAFGRERAGEPVDEDEVLRQEEQLLGGMTDRLAAALWGNQEYFEGLERSFEARLARRQTAGT